MNLKETAKHLAKTSELHLTEKKILEVLDTAAAFWRERLGEADELDLPGIGRIFPQRWRLGPQNSLYRTRVGKPPLDRMFTWRLKIEGDVGLKAKIRRHMTR